MKIISSSVLTAPDNLCIYSDFYIEKTLSFIRDLHFYSEYYDVVEIDFSQTHYITGITSLLILTHIHYIQLKKKNNGCFIFNCKKSLMYKSLFIGADYLKCLNMGCEIDNALSSSYIFKTYSIEDLVACRLQLRFFMDKIKKTYQSAWLTSFTEKQLRLFWRNVSIILTEILQNINHHAYPQDTDVSKQCLIKDESIFNRKLFWMAFWYDEKDHSMVFMFYDLGVGMINSYLYHSNRSDFAKQRLNSMTTEDLFRELISEGNSRYFGSGRGNGLDTTFNPKKFPTFDMSVLLFSNGIKCERISNTTKIQHFHHSLSLPGTAVEYKFKLPTQE